jgi:hypothetical protein
MPSSQGSKLIPLVSYPTATKKGNPLDHRHADLRGARASWLEPGDLSARSGTSLPTIKDSRRVAMHRADRQDEREDPHRGGVSGVLFIDDDADGGRGVRPACATARGAGAEAGSTAQVSSVRPAPASMML